MPGSQTCDFLRVFPNFCKWSVCAGAEFHLVYAEILYLVSIYLFVFINNMSWASFSLSLKERDTAPDMTTVRLNISVLFQVGKGLRFVGEAMFVVR